MLCEEKLSCR